MTGKDLVISWLNDAHAMESSLIQVLEHRVKDAKDYPEVQARDQQHLEQTRRHAELVKGLVEQLGGSTSAIKSGLASLFGQFNAPMTGAAQDELVKNFLTDNSAESFEVASYTSLIAAATALGEQNVVSTLQQILREDQDMADWLLQHLPAITDATLQAVAGAKTS